MGSSRVQVCVTFCRCDLTDGRTWGGRRGMMSSIQSSVKTRLQIFYGLRLPMKWGHSRVLLKSSSLVCSVRGCSRRNTWQRFLPGEGIHTEMERRAAPEAFLKSSAGFSQYLSWRVWELWHHLCGICGFSCILVLCNKLDTKFNRDTASYTPQVTKCGGQLIRSAYVLSRWGSVPEMVTPLFSLSSNWKYVLGLPRWLVIKESACQCRRGRRNEFSPSVGKISWKRK